MPTRSSGDNPDVEPLPGPMAPGTFPARLKAPCRRVARHELWMLAVAAPMLLFPGRWTPLAFGLIAATWFCRWVSLGRPSVPTPADLPIASMVAMSWIGYRVSVDPSASQASLWRIVLGVACFYGLVNAFRDEGRRRWLPRAAVWIGLATAALALLGSEWDAVRLFPLSRFYDLLPRLFRDVQDQLAFHPRVMGLALATWLPVPLAVLWFGRGMRERAWAGIAAVAMGLVLLLTQSLQGAFGVGCALLFLGICRSRRFLLTLPVGLAGLLWGLRAYGPQQAITSLLSLEHPLGIAAALRLDIWSRALAMIRNMPYTGIGLDTFAQVQSEFYPGVLIGPEPHAHNLYLQLALDLGLPGLLAFLWLLSTLGAAACHAYPRIGNPNRRALLVGAVGGLVSFLSAGALDTLWPAKPTVLLWLLLGLVAVLSTDGERRPGVSPLTRQSSWTRWVPAVLIVFALLPGLWLRRCAPELNLGAVRAQQQLWLAARRQAPAVDSLAEAAESLANAAELDAPDPHVYDLLGRSWAWLGEPALALDAFRARVAVDGVNPVARYDPSRDWLWRFAGHAEADRWEQLAYLYSQWRTRYPLRAEHYVLLALVRAEHQGNPQRAIALLQSGLDAGAEPRELLVHQLETIRNGLNPSA